MNIAFFELQDWEKDYIRKHLRGHRLLFFPDPLTEKNAAKAKKCLAITVFIYSAVTARVLSTLPKLQFIATMSTGFDHIDLKACRKRKVAVSNVPFYGENTVAEHTFALILALSRKIIDSADRTRRGDFTLSGLRGFDLKGKTLGVIGTGHIGQHVIRIAKGFEMDVVAYDVQKNREAAKQFGFAYTSLTTLLSKADIVTLHCPYNQATHHLLNRRNISCMKKGALLINTARGGLVETEALVSALHSGNLGGSALDVLEEEVGIKEEKQLLTPGFAENHNLQTLLQNHYLLTMRNVIITPHNAFNSEEALRRILDTTLENIKTFAAKKPVNVVL